MHASLLRSAMFAAVGGTLLLAGCASTDDVQKAQSTADQALAAAHHAQDTADQAKAEADQNRSDINSLDQRVQTLEQKPARHPGERG